MKYFILESDKDFCDGPLMENWKETISPSLVCKEHFHRVPERNIISISTTKDTIFPAILPYLLMSEMVKSVIDMYGDIL